MFKLQLPKSAVGPSMVIGSFYALGLVILMSTHLYLIEQYVCREHYASSESLDDSIVSLSPNIPIDETLCKKPVIQSTVAGIQGTYVFLSLTPSKSKYLTVVVFVQLTQDLALLLAGPWGRLSKILGKKTVILLNSSSAVVSTCFFVSVCKILTLSSK